MLKCVMVGAYGWAPSDWATQYYPADLPKNWQSTYYANEYSAVLLPQLVWQDGVAELADTLDDLPAGFKPVFELSVSDEEPTALDEQVFAAWQCLAQAVKTVMAAPEVLVPQKTSDQLLARLQQQTVCHRLSADGFLSEPAGTDYQLAVVKAEEPLTPLAIKAVIEQLKNNVEERVTEDEVYVFLDTPYQTLTQMQAMLELYGL